jgi:Lon protease-like protein
MTNFIPLFPLNIVVYPGEHLNLHIFEPRYKQLIQDCFESKKEFGIPVVMHNKVEELGTTVMITGIERVHENGEMDIRTIGHNVFRILENVTQIPDKLYQGAIVNYPGNNMEHVRKGMQLLIELVHQFHHLLEVTKEYKKLDNELLSYDLAHHTGLNLEQEYALLGLFDELQRIEFLKRHLQKTIPTIVELQNLKKRIEMNGHFRKLSVEDTNEE